MKRRKKALAEVYVAIILKDVLLALEYLHA